MVPIFIDMYMYVCKAFGDVPNLEEAALDQKH